MTHPHPEQEPVEPVEAEPVVIEEPVAEEPVEEPVEAPVEPAKPEFTKPDPRKPYKAVGAFLFTFVGLIVQALIAKGGDTSSITSGAWAVIILGSLATTGAVYGIPNPLDPKKAVEDV